MTPNGRTYPGDTYKIEATFTDDGVAFNPDSHQITLIDPAGETRQTVTSPTKIRTGAYRATLQIPDTATHGVWTAEWQITKDSEVDTETHNFRVHQTPT